MQSDHVGAHIALRSRNLNIPGSSDTVYTSRLVVRIKIIGL